VSQDIESEIEEATSSRRRLLTKGAAAAAVATVAGLAMSSKQTFAGNGNAVDFTQGAANTNATATTSLAGGSTLKVINGFSDGPGVKGSIYGTTNRTFDAGVIGESTATTSGIGVYGLNAATSLRGYGVMGSNKADDGIGVFGVHSATGGSTGVGVWAQTNKGNGLVARGTMYDVVASGNGKVLYGEASFTNPPTGASTVGTTGRDAAGNLWYSPASGVYRKLGGPDTAGQFHAISPVRVYDSRSALPTPGKLVVGSPRVVSVKDGRNQATGAVTLADAVPAGATAVFYNLTISATEGSGYLSVVPGDAATESGSSINWTSAGLDIANGLVGKVDASRQVKVFAGGGGTTHFIIDVTGYYL